MDLKEIYDGGKLSVIEEDAKTGILRVKFPFVLANDKNLNGREYPLALVEREVNKLNQKISEGESIYGFTGHPQTAHGELGAVSHMIEKLSVTTNIGWGIAKILTDSEHGKTLKMILKAGGAVGASMRGTGSVINGVVNEDYELLGVDYVISPSFGQTTKFDKSGIIEGQQKEADDLTLQQLYSESGEAGYRGTLEDFKKLRAERAKMTEKDRAAEDFIAEESGLAGKYSGGQK